MKHIIISGTARSGKTTLAKMLKEHFLSYNEFHGDCIREWMILLYGPERAREITHTAEYPEHMAKLTDAFLSASLYPCIVEWSRFFPRNERLIGGRHDCLFVYLGHGGLSAGELSAQIRKYESADDFTSALSDGELLSSCERWSETDKQILTECRLYNKPYYNTSDDRTSVISAIARSVIRESGKGR